MNQQNDGKGRPLEQQTRDGTSSAGSVGPGGTGSVGKDSSGRSQQAGRTVDLLSNGSEEEDSGYLHGGSADLQTGLGGMGSMSRSGGGGMQSAAGNQGSASIPDAGGQRSANQQSGAMNQQGLDSERLSDMDRDTGNLSRENQQNRQSGGGQEGARSGGQSNPAGQRGDQSR
ncbi:hypothetical protein [Massilia endophytica]|uniref:hypothetical protein n=1 Tax=Massilia endophytica TaxID=2899220 RepID=UPI001E4B0DDD|nr:hypothetical protein [Massilia endophytica]UGQ47537.1 hypothetical protein LSQ66_03375 [Massilia endophytica]